VSASPQPASYGRSDSQETTETTFYNMTDQHPITPPPPHLLKKFSAQAQDETKKRNGAGYLKAFATLCIEWALNSQPTPNDRQIRSSEITPPPELVQQWLEDAPEDGEFGISKHIATQAARWGSDQELEACCEWTRDSDGYDAALALRADRRPKPPSLKEQALKKLKDWTNEKHGPGGEVFLCEGLSVDIIRRALESLPE
jgi:hypothetical protein